MDKEKYFVLAKKYILFWEYHVGTLTVIFNFFSQKINRRKYFIPIFQLENDIRITRKMFCKNIHEAGDRNEENKRQHILKQSNKWQVCF